MTCKAAVLLDLEGCGTTFKQFADLKSFEKAKIKEFIEADISADDTLCLEHVMELGRVFKANCANPFGDHQRRKGFPVKSTKFLEIVTKRPNLINPKDSLCKQCIAKSTKEEPVAAKPASETSTTDSDDEDPFSTKNLDFLNTVRGLVGLKNAGYEKRNTAGKIKLVNDSIAEITTKIRQKFKIPEQVEETTLSFKAQEIQDRLNEASRSDRIKIAALFSRSLSLPKLSEVFKITRTGAVLARKLWDKPILSDMPRQKRKGVGADVEDSVVKFFVNDENSKQSPNVKDVFHLKKEDGSVEVTTRRYLLASVGELYARFTEENPQVKVGMTKFGQLRPKHCKLLKETKNQVCLCIYHENVRLLFESVDLKYSDYMKYMACDVERKSCMYRKCDQCCTEKTEDEFSRKLKADILEKHPEYEEVDINFQEWSQGGRDLLVKSSLGIEDFVDHLTSKMSSFLRHHFTTKAQSRAWKEMKATVDDTTVLMQCDFAENYSCSYNMEVQKVYFNQIQTTLHPFVATLKNKDGVPETRSFVVVSDDLTHNANTYYAFQRAVLQEIKKDYGHITQVVYWSDGAGSQYKNFKNMCNLKFHKADNGLEASHSFFASCHGKGPCDAIGGVVKSKLRSAAKAGGIIQNPNEVFAYLQSHPGKILPIFVSSEDVEAVMAEMCLEERYTKATKIPRIREMHRVVAKESALDLYELSTDDTICCTLSFEEAFDGKDVEPGEWIAAIYEREWYYGKIKSVLSSNDELKVNFLGNPGEIISTFTNKSFEKCATIVPFCHVICKVASPIREGRSRTFHFAPETKQEVVAKFEKMK